MEEYAAHAVKVGLSAMAFTAHFPIGEPNAQPACIAPGDVEGYVKEIERLREVFSGRLEVVTGFEVDYFEGYEEFIEKECIKKWSPDFVMGSIHIIDGWLFDHPKYVDGYADWDITELYRTYYARMERLVESGLFHVLGHIDLVKKFGYRPEGDVSDAVASVLDAVSERGMYIEANTAGFDKPVGEMYPSLDILEAAAERKIGVVAGSDSHAPEEVGRHFSEALELLERAGYGSVRADADRKLSYFVSE